MDMIKALEISLDLIKKERGLIAIKQILIEYEKGSLADNGTWFLFFLPQELDNLKISDIVKVRVNEQTQCSSIIEI